MITDKEYTTKLLKIGLLADIFEAEVKSLHPEHCIKNSILVMKIRNAQLHASNLRKYFDGIYEHLAASTGDYYDKIDEAIDNKIIELDTDD